MYVSVNVCQCQCECMSVSMYASVNVFECQCMSVSTYVSVDSYVYRVKPLMKMIIVVICMIHFITNAALTATFDTDRYAN